MICNQLTSIDFEKFRPRDGIFLGHWSWNSIRLQTCHKILTPTPNLEALLSLRTDWRLLQPSSKPWLLLINRDFLLPSLASNEQSETELHLLSSNPSHDNLATHVNESSELFVATSLISSSKLGVIPEPIEVVLSNHFFQFLLQVVVVSVHFVEDRLLDQ